MPSAIDLFIFSAAYATTSLIWVVYRRFWGDGKPSINDKIALVGGVQWLVLQLVIVFYLLFFH